MFCPTLDQLTDAALALLPRGRAWQTNEGLPTGDTVIAKYWRAFADVMKYLTDRACALRLEMFCATHTEMHAEWLKEYGLPDDCDPFPDVCIKVAAIGGTRCEYYQEIAARMGWSVTCETQRQCFHSIGSRTAGCLRVGSRSPNAFLFIRVNINDSPAMTSPVWTPPLAGRLKTGMRLHCEPNINPLKCLLTRIVHAEIVTEYEIWEGPSGEEPVAPAAPVGEHSYDFSDPDNSMYLGTLF